MFDRVGGDGGMTEMDRIESAAKQSYFYSCHKVLTTKLFVIVRKYYRENRKTSINK